MSKILLFIVMVLFIIIAVLGVVLLMPAKKVSAPAPVVLDEKNVTYIIENQPVTLVNGYSEISAAPGSASKIITKYFGNDSTADLNGDGKEDKVFLLTQEAGGSGMFYYLAVALKIESGYLPLNTVFLGDRIAVQSTQITNGQIVVNYADRKPGEPMTTVPSVGISKYFGVENGKLVEQIPPAIYGAPVTLEIGKQVKFNDGLVVTLSKIDDSRCKPNMVCIWAGELAPAFTITGGTGGSLTKQIQLGNIKTKKLTVDGYTFELKDVTATTATVTVMVVNNQVK